MNEAELLFTSILNCERASLYLNKNKVLDRKESSFISSVLKRRFLGDPIQYILGRQEFMGLEFRVNKDVLIPRQETEILVEIVLQYVTRSQGRKDTSVNILDIGTGSGCIAISLAKFLPDVKITATDISQEALNIAVENAKAHRAEDRISFICGDLFTPYAIRLTPYDLIVSNPPYIPGAEIAGLQPEISYEPAVALDGGEDGLDFYRRIIQESPLYLKPGGFLIMETGIGQSGEIKNIFKIAGNFEIIEVVKDYNGIDRVAIARLL